MTCLVLNVSKYVSIILSNGVWFFSNIYYTYYKWMHKPLIQPFIFSSLSFARPNFCFSPALLHVASSTFELAFLWKAFNNFWSNSHRTIFARWKALQPFRKHTIHPSFLFVLPFSLCQSALCYIKLAQGFMSNRNNGLTM